MESTVEWLIEEYAKAFKIPVNAVMQETIKQAKEMEKEQRKQDFIAGCNACGFEYAAEDWAKEYFENKLKPE
jgi:hypothetical protein